MNLKPNFDPGIQFPTLLNYKAGYIEKWFIELKVLD